MQNLVVPIHQTLSVRMHASMWMYFILFSHTISLVVCFILLRISICRYCVRPGALVRSRPSGDRRSQIGCRYGRPHSYAKITPKELGIFLRLNPVRASLPHSVSRRDSSLDTRSTRTRDHSRTRSHISDVRASLDVSLDDLRDSHYATSDPAASAGHPHPILGQMPLSLIAFLQNGALCFPT